MKQFVLGAALLMFVWSLPADATNDHSMRSEPASKPQTVAFIKPQTVAFMQAFGDTLPPIGYVTFCRDHQAECQPSQSFADRVRLTPGRRAELERVNDRVNAAVSPVTDLDLYGKVEVWAYPSGKGDCEDYVLLKRRMLIERGWPESTLLITVVRDENDEGHAVLTARTDQGDLVLDNKQREIMSWTDTPYTFIKRQSERNPLVWTSLLPPAGEPQPAISASNTP